RRNVGRLLTLTPVEGSAVTGRIARASDRAVTVVVDGEETTVPYAAVSRAVVQVEFSRRTDGVDADRAAGDDVNWAGAEHDDAPDPEES
ncbi:MAG: hypothetical protein ABI131_05090, partial [Nostocoides sp.]